MFVTTVSYEAQLVVQESSFAILEGDQKIEQQSSLIIASPQPKNSQLSTPATGRKIVPDNGPTVVKHETRNLLRKLEQESNSNAAAVAADELHAICMLSKCLRNQEG